MSAPQPKTVEEHGDFLREMVRLQLWFAASWIERHRDEDLPYVLRNRVDIFRKTDLNVGKSKNTTTAGDFTLPAWLELESQLVAVHRETESEGPDAFEAAAWPLLQPLVDARVERDFAEGDGLDNFQCGSLRYSNSAKGSPPRVFFHMGNTIAPHSIFEDPQYLPACLRQLMRETRDKLGAAELATKSWLNSYPRWCSLFPQEWLNHLTAPDESVGWSQGHWGQFVNARGTFNHKHGSMLRQTGELPFKPRGSWCSFAALEEHLAQELP